MDKIKLLVIDPQIDFHPQYVSTENKKFDHPMVSSAVQGANDDMERIVKMIKNNINKIDEIYVTLDSHHVIRITYY